MIDGLLVVVEDESIATLDIEWTGFNLSKSINLVEVKVKRKARWGSGL